MTAAVEGVSLRCNELARIFDEAFDQAMSATRIWPFGCSSCKDFNSSITSSKAANHRIAPKKKIPKISPYFVKAPLKKTNSQAKVSCIPFPPLQSASFGLVQESLSHDPFRLFIAVIFLNKTRGSVALPVFYELMERYPTPSDLSAAKREDVVEVIQHLGLQNQRAATCINLAKAWLERPPERGKRHRVLHYPKHGDGKDIRPGEIIDEIDERVAWEVGVLPGVGAYAIDSWRIFCRDQLRGLPSGLPENITEEEKELEMQKEWTKVLPMDKELRAYLRWRWLRNGWDWDPLTGEREAAGLAEMEKAEKGGVIYEGEDMGVIISEQETSEIVATNVEPADGEESKIESLKPQD